MRSTIKAVFPDRDVVTIVRPALTEQKLQKLDTLPAAELRPEFRKVARGLRVFGILWITWADTSKSLAWGTRLTCGVFRVLA